MHWDVVAGPGSQGEGPESLRPKPAPAEAAGAWVPDRAPGPEGTLELDAALLLASFLAEGPASPELWVQERGPALKQACAEVAARTAAWAPEPPAEPVRLEAPPAEATGPSAPLAGPSVAEPRAEAETPPAESPALLGALSPALPAAPSLAPPQAEVEVTSLWRHRAEAAEAAASAWGERMLQASTLR